MQITEVPSTADQTTSTTTLLATTDETRSATIFPTPTTTEIAVSTTKEYPNKQWKHQRFQIQQLIQQVYTSKKKFIVVYNGA